MPPKKTNKKDKSQCDGFATRQELEKAYIEKFGDDEQSKHVINNTNVDGLCSLLGIQKVKKVVKIPFSGFTVNVSGGNSDSKKQYEKMVKDAIPDMVAEAQKENKAVVPFIKARNKFNDMVSKAKEQNVVISLAYENKQRSRKTIATSILEISSIGKLKNHINQYCKQRMGGRKCQITEQALEIIHTWVQSNPNLTLLNATLDIIINMAVSSVNPGTKRKPSVRITNTKWVAALEMSTRTEQMLNGARAIARITNSL